MYGDREISDEFRVNALKNTLRRITVSSDLGERVGVPPELLEQWLRGLAAHLDDLGPAAHKPEPCPEPAARSPLSAGEIHFLLRDFETMVPRQAW